MCLINRVTGEAYLGSFTMDENISEAAVGELMLKKLKKSQKVIVSVYTGERTFPHVHVHNEVFHSCPCLDTNMYFIHDGKEDEFNGVQCKQFDTFMRSKNKTQKDKTNFEVACEIWNNADNMVKLKPDVPIPDYTALSGDVRKSKEYTGEYTIKTK